MLLWLLSMLLLLLLVPAQNDRRRSVRRTSTGLLCYAAPASPPLIFWVWTIKRLPKLQLEKEEIVFLMTWSSSVLWRYGWWGKMWILQIQGGDSWAPYQVGLRLLKDIDTMFVWWPNGSHSLDSQSRWVSLSSLLDGHRTYKSVIAFSLLLASKLLTIFTIQF